MRGGIHLARNGGRLAVGGALDGAVINCKQLPAGLGVAGDSRSLHPIPSREMPRWCYGHGVTDGRGWRLRGVIEAAVALLGRPWRLWRYGKTKRHGRKPYSIRHRAFVAFVASHSCLGPANKKKKDDTLHPPADNITAR